MADRRRKVKTEPEVNVALSALESWQLAIRRCAMIPDSTIEDTLPDFIDLLLNGHEEPPPGWKTLVEVRGHLIESGLTLPRLMNEILMIATCPGPKLSRALETARNCAVGAARQQAGWDRAASSHSDWCPACAQGGKCPMRDWLRSGDEQMLRLEVLLTGAGALNTKACIERLGKIERTLENFSKRHPSPDELREFTSDEYG